MITIDVPHQVVREDFVAFQEATLRQTPWGRLGTPEDIANLVLILCSPQTEYVTGTVISADGGLTSGRYGIPVAALQKEVGER